MYLSMIGSLIDWNVYLNHLGTHHSKSSQYSQYGDLDFISPSSIRN